MDIQGPFKIGVLDRPEGGGRELHFTFTDEFRGLDLPAQAETFRGYLVELQAQVRALPEEDRNRQGMLLVMQVAEQMLPYIESGEMALSETIVVVLTPEQGESFSVMDLLPS